VISGVKWKGEELDNFVLGNQSIPGTMHNVLSKIRAPPLFMYTPTVGENVSGATLLRYHLTTDATVSGRTGVKNERNTRVKSVGLGDVPWHVDLHASPPTMEEMNSFRSDVIGDGNKAGSYTKELTSLLGTVAAGQIDKSTTAGIMLRKMYGDDIRHLMVKGVLYQMLITHMYTLGTPDVVMGQVGNTTHLVQRDYLISGIQDAAALVVDREVLSVETNTVLRICASRYPVMSAPGHRTKYTNIHMEQDDLRITSYFPDKALSMNPELVLHPERWWNSLCNLATTLGRLDDLAYAYNFILGWPDAFDIFRAEGLVVSGGYHLPFPLSRGTNTLFGDTVLRCVDVLQGNTNKLASSSLIILNRIIGSSIAGLMLDIIDDLGLCDSEIYGAALARSELANGVRLDMGLDLEYSHNNYHKELMIRHGKRGSLSSRRFTDMLDAWPGVIHHSYARHGDWIPHSVDCQEAAMFGKRVFGVRMGLLSSVGDNLSFSISDTNYTRNGEKSWEISAWCVLNGFMERRWLLVGPIIASKAGVGPIEAIFCESRFTIGGTYTLDGQGISVPRVRGKKGIWKSASDRLDINNYYQGAFSLLQGMFIPQQRAREEEPIVDEEVQARRQTTLRHQPVVQPVDIEVRPSVDTPISERLAESLGQEENFEVIAASPDISKLVPEFSEAMNFDINLGIPSDDKSSMMWCTILGEEHKEVKNVIAGDGLFRLVEKKESPGAATIRTYTKVRDVTKAKPGDDALRQILHEARQRPVPVHSKTQVFERPVK